MTWKEWVGLVSLVVIVAGGAVGFGELRGELDALDSDKIDNARDEAVAAINERLESVVSANPEFKTWKWDSDMGPVELIPVRDGICYLTGVAGFFRDRDRSDCPPENLCSESGDQARVFEQGDYWFLGGSSSEYPTVAWATCWRFPWSESTE